MRFSGLSVRQLEAFEATVETGSVSAAASVMNVSQPSVSRLLQDLERDTDLILFVRNQGRLLPTEQGVLFYEEVSRTFRSARELMRTAQEIRQLKHGVVRLGTLAAMSFEVVPEAMRQFRERFPQASTTVAVHDSREIAASVSARLTDIGIVDAGVPFLDAVCVANYEKNGVCVMDEGHPLANSKSIGLQDLERYPFVSLGSDYLCRTPDGEKLAKRVAGNVVANTFQSFLACALVRRSTALAVVDPFTASFYSSFSVLSKPLDLQIPYRLAILNNQRSATSAAAQEFLEILDHELRSI